ncbi:hypothetical protein PsalN5692_03941 (plasmid) [Piscirickettsia salmonis]|uniref:hypothetical protein n=1 Tax=Piscirickettsia salmonis TaxID=1238 RepID=UPI0012BA0506|nr:hypothetical protein [Piscirickettsia salmonis]QGP52432.1 hypothetical protein PsalN5692_03941 [Piscirickettsia salmonis]
MVACNLVTLPRASYYRKKQHQSDRKRRYLGRYFAHPMMQNRRAKRDDYKPSAVRVTQRCVP